ncbi:MAG: T9SS type A sorting domain-containing protein [Flavipsychrobacter sp.]|nr:T9SS type A sorting domain-containing protein [Flavipsychrobacter sp.]
MKRTFIIAASLLLSTGAIAQKSIQPMQTGKHTDKRAMSRQYVRQLMGGQAAARHANKSTAANQRMIGYSNYQMNQQFQLQITDSGGLSYSGMRGSEFDFNSMSIGSWNPVFAPVVPYNKLSFKADVFNIYQNNNTSSIVGGYTFTYNNDENITEVYTADYSANPDTRILLTYNGLDPVFVEYLSQNGSNWDTLYRRYFTYGTNGLVSVDSLYENVNSIWNLVQKFEYGYDMNDNLNLLTISAEVNNVYGLYGEEQYTYDNNDHLVLAFYNVYDGSQSMMVPDGKDSFDYDQGVDFYTSETYFEWDDVNLVWENNYHETRHLNTQLLPDTVSVYEWNGTAWAPYYVDFYEYNTEGNPVNDTLYGFTNMVQDEDPGYVGHFYYEAYWPASVQGTVQAAAQVTVYPNPATDILNIKGSGPMQLQLVNALGQVLKKARSSEQAKLAIGDLAPGMYWLTVSDINGATLRTQAVVKE